MKYPIVIASMRLADGGFPLDLGAGTGNMTQDVVSGTDRLGRHVHIERHEHATFIYREVMDAQNEPQKGVYHLLDIISNTLIKVAKPIAPSASPPEMAPRGPSPVQPAPASKGK